MARPEGALHGARDHVAVTFSVAASMWRSWFVSSILTKTFPLPSVAENSGLPGNGMVAITLLDEVSITVASLLPPLNAKTRRFVGSNKIASGFLPAGIVTMTLKVERLNARTEPAPPSLM